MCRLLAYLGTPIPIDSLLVRPSHSLIKQSMHADESKFIVNGDGFGMSWHVDFDPEPALFKTLRPAWNDPNLTDIACKTKTHCLNAHIRAATSGNVSFNNSHPFRFKQYSMMHNGSIKHFDTIKRHLQHQLTDTAYNWIGGQTDTEHFFAVLIDRLLQYENKSTDSRVMIQCLEDSIIHVNKLLEQQSIKPHITLNTIITDGNFLVATRYASPEVEPPSLHYITGSGYECIEEQYHIHQRHSTPSMIIVASEILSEQGQTWVTVPPNHALQVNRGQTPSITPFPS